MPRLIFYMYPAFCFAFSLLQPSLTDPAKQYIEEKINQHEAREQQRKPQYAPQPFEPTVGQWRLIDYGVIGTFCSFLMYLYNKERKQSEERANNLTLEVMRRFEIVTGDYKKLTESLIMMVSNDAQLKGELVEAIRSFDALGCPVRKFGKEEIENLERSLSKGPSPPAHTQHR